MNLRVLRITRGILVGLLVDLFGSFAYSLVLGILMGLILNWQGVPSAELGLAMRDAVVTPLWVGLALVGGSLISISAGFIAANIIQTNYFNALGIMGTLLALISYSHASDLFSQSTQLSFALIGLVAVLAGGWLHRWATG